VGEPNLDNMRHLGSRSQVLTGIQEWILNEHLRAGDPLPPERDLARSLGVGTLSIREAFRVLESLGILEPGPTGELVAAARPAIGLHTLLRLHVSLSGFDVTDLMSIRIELERSSAARAATEAAPEDLGPMRSVVEAMARPTIDHARFGELDCEFHLSLARAAHNDLAAVLLASLSDAVKNEMSASYARTPNWQRTADRLAAEHAWILTSIENGDPDRAADVITKHIAGFYDLRAG
jgi:GntR family transcriptional regulator, transcriptional repressor for pyruvate dehydrogenase complex